MYVWVCVCLMELYTYAQYAYQVENITSTL